LKKINIILLGLIKLLSLISLNIYSQNSFLKEIDFENRAIYLFDIDEKNRISKINTAVLIDNENFKSLLNLINLNSGGEIESSFSFSVNPPISTGIRPDTRISIIAKDEYRICSFSEIGALEYSGFLCFNLNTETVWARQTKKRTFKVEGFTFVTSRNKVLASIRPYSDQELNYTNFTGFNGLASFEMITGKANWANTYHKDSLNSPLSFDLQGMVELSNGNLVGHSNILNSDFQNVPGLIKLSESGQIFKSISFDSIFSTRLFYRELYNFQSITLDTNDNIYVSGKLDRKSEWNNNNSKEGFIAKFDSDLNLIWSKRLSSENFNINGLSIDYHPNDNIVFAYYTTGDFPVIIGQINLDGKLEETIGMALNKPTIQVGSDGSIVMMSGKKLQEDGTTVNGLILGKTNPDGTMDNCPQFNSCLSLFDFDLTYQPVTWHAMPADTLERFDVLMRRVPLTSKDYCVTPTPSTANFSLPDTICQNQCLSPDSLNNRLAHAVNWTIHKDSILLESENLSFDYCFTQPGTYQIEQEVWLLGCSEFFTHELVVLSNSLGDLLGDDKMVCEDSFLVLSPNVTRPVNSFQWNDGTTDSTLNISSSGTYTVTVSDGFCTEQDRIEVTFYDEWLVGTDLALPNDTSLCADFLPFNLKPKSDFSNEFFLNGDANPQSEFSIIGARNYQISTNIEGCKIVKQFNLELTSCEIDIYIPSSFSPNNDGINDSIEPLGNDFLAMKLEIYDRWGGKLFETTEAPFSWSGDEATEGVYALVFSYLNLKNQKEEVVSADVLVIR